MRQRGVQKALPIAIAAICIAVETGCAARPRGMVLEPSERGTAPRAIAIAPAKFDPSPEYVPDARGVGKGAGKGAATGAAAGVYYGAAIPIEMASQDPRGGIFLLLIPFTVAAGAAIGTVAGTVGGTAAAVPESTAQRVDASIAAGIAALKAPQAVGESVMDELSRNTTARLEWMPNAGAIAPNGTLQFASLKSSGADAAIDVRVLSIGFEGTGGANPSLVLIARASASLVYVDQERSAASVAPVFRSAPHPYSDWEAENGKLLQEELRRARFAFAEHMVDQLVLIPAAPRFSDAPACGPNALPPAASTPSSVASRGNADSPDGAGKQPVPPVKTPLRSASGPVGLRSGTGNVITSNVSPEPSPQKVSSSAIEVQSDKVILRWERYPSERQRGLIQGDLLDGIHDTVYDLKVWTVGPSGIPSTAYARRAIADTSHAVEVPLAPGPVYYWSVRARFHYRGRDAGTPWSGEATPEDLHCAAFPFPDSRRFQFRTSLN
jgi:hypothetical protein